MLDNLKGSSAVGAAVIRRVWQFLALFFIVCAFIGVLLPGVPTTIFVILAAGSAAKGSPKIRHWLETHPIFGKSLKNWHDGGFIAAKTKRVAWFSMAIAAAMVCWVVPLFWPRFIALAGIMIGAMVVWSRPEPPASDEP